MIKNIRVESRRALIETLETLVDGDLVEELKIDNKKFYRPKARTMRDD